jgi:DNA-binding transcriptional MerR regulator
MVEISAEVEIPNRALFKAAEVCELVNVQPYVLRSWEAEFPELGVAKTSGGSRVYRRADVEQVLRIKRLLVVDGLTVAGVRRRLQEETAPLLADTPLDELIGQNARERLTEVRKGLRAILDLLAGGRVAGEDFRLAAPQTSVPALPARVRRVIPPVEKAPAARKSPGRRSGRGKRSA